MLWIPALAGMTALVWPPLLIADTKRPVSLDSNPYRDTIKSTKAGFGRETELEFLYADALDLFNARRYEESLNLLDRIVESDPSYKDAARLRATVQKTLKEQTQAANMTEIRQIMRDGDRAYRRGERIIAINTWKKALAIDPEYAPAKKKIQQTHKELGKKQLDTFYLYYNEYKKKTERDVLETALEAGANAVALDPELKSTGLLPLMATLEQSLRKADAEKLAAEAYTRYTQGDLTGALEGYESVQAMAPRHPTAKQMTTKIRYELGQMALEEAQKALAAKKWEQARDKADEAIQYQWEVRAAEKIKADAERYAKAPPKPPPPPKTSTAPKVSPQTTPTPPPPEPKVIDRDKALSFYRKGLAAVRSKDFQAAVEHLEKAAYYDGTDELIYVALERARQERDGAKTAGGLP